MSSASEIVIRGLGLDPLSPGEEEQLKVRTIEFLIDRMEAARERIREQSDRITTRLKVVEQRFQDDHTHLAGVRLNELGELQALGPEYDAAIAAFAALHDQLDMYTQRIAKGTTRPGTYAERKAAGRPKPTLYVRTQTQKILWEQELAGQISDGHWENARPHDHWKVWCDAEVVVRPTAPGRTFYARKTNYNFTDSWLLDIIGERMVAAVQAAGQPDYNHKAMLRDLRDLKAIIKNETTHDAID